MFHGFFSIVPLSLFVIYLSVITQPVDADEGNNTNSTTGEECSGRECLTGKPQDSHHDHEICSMINDPAIKFYYGEVAEVPVHGKFLLTHVESKAKVTKTNTTLGECTFRCLSWGRKGEGRGRKGKLLIGGIELQLTVLINNKMFHHATRIQGFAKNGIYTFIEEGNKKPMAESDSWGKGIKTKIPRAGTVETVYDPKTNVAKIMAQMCGLTMGFRPPEEQCFFKSAPIPGVYIKVDNSYEPRYIVSDAPLCFAPKGHGQTLRGYMDRLEREYGLPVRKDMAMMHRMLKGSTNQQHPGASPRLQSVADLAQECDSRYLLTALDKCMFVLRTPKFRKCWNRPRRKKRGKNNPKNEGDVYADFDDPQAKDKVLLLMHGCMGSLCCQSCNRCKRVQNIIRKSPCARQIRSYYNTILQFDCHRLERPCDR